MQLKINSVENCVLEQEHSIEFFVHFEFEFFVIEFDI